jgi:hypothetical protein
MMTQRCWLQVMAIAAILTAGATAGCDHSGPQPAAAPSNLSSSHASQPAAPAGPVASCTAASIRLHPSHVTNLDGHEIDSLYIANESKSPCTVAGFPAVTLRDHANALINTSEIHGGTEWGDPTAATFTLAPGDGIGFNIQVTANGKAATCWNAMTIDIVLPTAHGSIKSPTTSDYRGFQACGTALHVASFYAPVFPARS